MASQNTRKSAKKAGRTFTSGLQIKGKPRLNKWALLVLVLFIGVFGAWRIFFAGAAPNNCQPENGVNICDVDQVAGGSDTVLSVDAEAQILGNQGWGWYYGAAFRAPTQPYNNAVAVHRVYNDKATYHDWVTDAQKREKEAKYGPNTYEGVAFFAWEKPGQPGTVPVYRLTRSGGASQTIFSTDKAWVDKMLAESGSNPDGWKQDTVAPGIAFYAYPPNYKVAGQQNPYDCSILENFVSDRCQAPRENLVKAVEQGKVPTTNECPKTLKIYQEAPFPGQFSQDCQTFWNTYMKDCSISENFLADRCKAERETVAKAAAEQARLRAEAAAKARAKAAQASRSRSSGSTSTANTGGKGGGPDQTGSSSQPQVDLNALARSFGAGYFGGGGTVKKGTCTITWKMEQFWGVFGATTGKSVYKNITQGDCLNRYLGAKRKTIDGMNRRHYGYNWSWRAN